MLSQVPPSWPHFRFSHSPLKTLSFFRSPQNLSQKNNDPELIHRWIKFGYNVHNTIPNIFTVGNFKIISEIRGKPFAMKPFIFPQKSKTISVKLWSRFRYPLDFHENWICCSKFNCAQFHCWYLRDNICGGWKRNLMKTVQVEVSISSPSLWRLGILSEQSEE